MPSNVSGGLVRRGARRAAASALILLVIIYLTFFGLLVAERGRKGLPAQPLGAAAEALIHTGSYLFQHPPTHYWHKQTVPALALVLTAVGRSAGLLGLALALATAVGVPLGIMAAASKRRNSAPFVLLLSILGVSTPSFLLAMLLWVIMLQLNRHMGLPALPAVGFGWDSHAILPVLVLAARPLAQIVQITYVSLSAVLTEDYVRTARGKGLSERWVLLEHALRNVRIPVLTTLGTSLRFSLASLPVVEFFFMWPGLGLTILQAIQAGETVMVVDLSVALGLLFLIINLILNVIYPLLDPRLANGQLHEHIEDQIPLGERIADLADSVRRTLHRLQRRSAPTHVAAPPLPALPATQIEQVDLVDPAPARHRTHRYVVRSTIGNPTLVLGTLLVVGLVALALFGERLTTASAYETHGVLMINGKIGAPPYPPSPTFPWGSDQVGRDVQALVLAGAKRTLALAFFGATARVLLGAILGALAAWWQDGRLDRLVTGGVAVWAAFPATIFAMILIQALGIQQGMWVFVVALCLVGWGEIAQFVRSQVLAVKPQPYVEGARSVGARADRILLGHVLPNILPALVVLAVLEMGAVLMLLAELGFLNIFMGGGFRAEISPDSGQVFAYSDVPEWGALLANIRLAWRSNPWLAWYPGIFFFMAILAFNLWGEGLRRFLDATRFNVIRIFNRYAVMAGVAAIGVMAFVLNSTAPLGLYRSQAALFDASLAMQDIRTLAGDSYAGRETGYPPAEAAARYIGDRMQEVGLFPAGQGNTYIQSFPCGRPHLTGQPELAVLDGSADGPLAYRQDFAEYIGPLLSLGSGQGQVVGVALGPRPEGSSLDPYRLNRTEELHGKIMLMREDNLWHPSSSFMAGELIITRDPDRLRKRLIYRVPASALAALGAPRPVMYISEPAADRLLRQMGSSLAEFDATIAGLAVGEHAFTAAGPAMKMTIPATQPAGDAETCYNVIGYIPGTAARSGPRLGEGLDSQVIMISAYYDGLGTAPDGSIYPGANDNASGVASMLEMARVLKTATYAPKKTVVFVARSEGERGRPLIIGDIMNAKTGFHLLTTEAVIELSGMGAGRGSGLALGQGSSFRLVQLFQKAASRMGVPTTTRGRDPHYGLPPENSAGKSSALAVFVSWDGSDDLSHTPQDTASAIDPARLERSGEAVLLAVSVLSRETEY